MSKEQVDFCCLFKVCSGFLLTIKQIWKYNATMLEIELQPKFKESEISLLKEWLPKISEENRAYIKGAAKALLYAQENQDALTNPRSKQGAPL